MLTVIYILLAGVLPVLDGAAATAHRDSSGLDPATTYYFSVNHLPPDRHEPTLAALRLILPSLTLEPIVDYQKPNPAGEGLYWIDTAAFGWESRFPIVAARNPYAVFAKGRPSLVIRADWFITFATDAKESTSYYDLLFGAPPATRDDFLSRVGVSRSAGQSFGLIEGNSGVILSKKRWIESFGMRQGYAYGTRDSSTINDRTDPTLRPDGSFQHEAEEWIVGIPKIHTATGTRGALQVYLLSNAAGQRQEAAPPDVASDYTRVRHNANEIRNGVSCIACHAEGLIDVKSNEVRELIGAGAELYASDKTTQRKIESFHLSDLENELRENRKEFAAIVEAVTDKPPREAVADFVSTVKLYDSPLTIETAAREVGVIPDDLTKAIGYAQNSGIPVHPRLIALAHGFTIPRTSWESIYSQAVRSVQDWRSQP
jgi:hypothetical protein